MESKLTPEEDKHPVDQRVADYYDQRSLHEWERMQRHPTEFALTLRALKRYLPPPPARILDCGGGPGRYSIELAKLGYQVTLFDLSAENLRLARHQADVAGVELVSYEQGNAMRLERFADGAFEAVLLMGPLYHLLEEWERRQALSEASRVTLSGGILFVAFISRYAGFREIARSDPAKLLYDSDVAARILESGQLLPRPGQSTEFTAYFAFPREVEPFLQSCGLEVETLIGVEGLVSMNDQAVNQQTGEVWERWVDLNERVSTDPSILGCVEHLLAVARKPLWRAVLASLARQLNQHGIWYTLVGGASLALHGVAGPVKDMDLEMDVESAYRFQSLFENQAIEKVELRESEFYRSHFGRFDFSGLKVEVMGDLQRKESGSWVPTAAVTREEIYLSGVPVSVSWLEEETLANIRRGRLDRAGKSLPLCNRERLLSLLRGQPKTQVV